MKELRDQSAHMAAAILCLLPIIMLPNMLGGALSGFLVGMVRELTEEGRINLEALRGALHSRLDLTFWTVGGALAGIIA